MIASDPYFMKRKEWYVADIEHTDRQGRGIHLTEEGKRHPKAVKSYEEYYADDGDDDG